MLKMLAIGGLSVFGILCIITTYACCNAAGRADEWEEQFIRQSDEDTETK